MLSSNLALSFALYLHDAENFWREEANRLESLIRDADDMESALEDYREARKNAEEIHKEKKLWTTMALRGLYDPIANAIKLYPEEMTQEYSGSCMDELLVSTLAHETMHAYFNRPHHKSFPYVILVEESLAEFGMLLYLNETGSTYYNWAYQDISSKKTCYRYGANLMDQHLNEGQNSFLRQYLEAYKIKLNNYPVPTVDPAGGTIILPKKVIRSNVPVQVGGQNIKPYWHDVFKCPPRYFYDHLTNTLGMDGDWSENSMHLLVGMDIMIHIHIMHHNPINQAYLGDNFIYNHYPYLLHILSQYQIFVSPVNKQFYAKNGVLFYKKNNKPVLDECGNGLYKLCRNGKWGVVDAQLNQIVPFKYDSMIWAFDCNGLMRVVLNNPQRVGFINKHGQEQIPLEYEQIGNFSDGAYSAKRNGAECKINKFGNEI